MERIVRCCFAVILVFSINKANAQSWMRAPYLPSQNLNDTIESYSFYDIQKAFEAYEKDYSVKAKTILQDEQDEESGNSVPGLFQYKRWENYMAPRVYPSGDISLPSGNAEHFRKYVNSQYYRNRNTKSSFATANWTPMGPFTNPANNNGLGRINFVRFDPSDNNTMYIGSPSGGLWKSTDGGSSWNTNTDYLSVIGCSDIAIDPTNSNILYLSTGDFDAGDNFSVGILKSTDGGATWDTTGLTWTVSQRRRMGRIIINPLNSNSILTASKSGVFKSTDAGATWTSTIVANVSDITYNPQDTSIVYITSQSVVASTKFFKSTDGGLTWAQITAGLPVPTSVQRLQIGVCPGSPNSVYVLAAGCQSCPSGFNGLYLSTDTGNTFTLQSSSPDIIGNQGWYDLAIAVNPSNINDVYVGGINQYHSVDGGHTWTAFTGLHADVHAITFLPGDSTTLFSCNDGGLFKSTNNGGAWNVLNNGLNISQMYRLGTSATDTSLTLTGFQDEGTNRLISGSWIRTFGADGMECIVDYTDDNTMYWEIQYGAIYKSTDGGPTVTPVIYSNGSGVNAQGPWVTPYVMNPVNHNTLLVGKSHVYRSTDGGSSWAQVGTPSGSMVALAYAPSDTNYMYAVTQSNFYVSVDGNNFTDRTGTLPVSLALPTYVTVSSTDPAKVWVTFSGYSDTNKVYMSTDAGMTWVNYSTGLPNLPVSCIVYQDGSANGLYVGTDVGVYYIDSTLSTWQPYFDGLPNVAVDELEIVYSAGKIRAATFGRGLWESDLATPLPTAIAEHASDNAFSIIPNPNNGKFKIATGNVQVKKVNIFNTDGKLIYESDKKDVEIDLSSQSKGTYIVEITTGDTVYRKKVIVY